MIPPLSLYGGAHAGANSDITSLSGLTTPLTVPQGGSGVATLTGLAKGNGASAMSAAVEGTDYYKPGGTDVAIADGGTASSTAANARTALAVARNPLAVRGLTSTGTTAVATDDVFLCDATLGAATVTLPAVVIGTRFRLYKTDATANAGVFAAGGGDTINGVTGTTVQFGAVEVVGTTATTWDGSAV